MSKAPVDIIKYIIHADAEATGLVEKPDLIGAIFGQTEGLLGEDLDLRELQKSGRIGRIDADIETKKGVTNAKVTIPSSLDMVETSIIAAGIETITRVGPCDAVFKLEKIEDVRDAKRKEVVNRARDILKTFMSNELPDSKEISEELRQDIRTDDIIKVEGLDAGPAVKTSDEVIIVEGRADVLNLLRNGIKNGIAVGGIKIPLEIVEITKNKMVTVFVDGDRGGDLILKSLKGAGVEIDEIARAPTGREVEDLARKEIIMGLRRKKPAADVFKELEGDTKDDRKSSRDSTPRTRSSSDSTESRSSGREGSSRDSRSSSREGSSRDSRSSSREGSSRDSRSSSREGSSRDSRSSSREGSSRDSRDSRSGGRERDSRSRSRDSGDRRDSRDGRDREMRERAPREEVVAKPTESGMLLEKLSGIKNQALLLDDKFEEIKKVDLDLLKKEKSLKKAYAIVIDDIVTNDLIALADKCKYIVGITTAGNLNSPKDKIIVTKF
jgi:DNA primase